MADEEVKLDPETLHCAAPGCTFTVKRGVVNKGCTKCGGKFFVDNVRKAKIEKENAAI